MSNSLLVAVLFVISVATMIQGQGLPEECRRPPQIDPRNCCNITKSFVKTEFAECFTDEVGGGAGGFRGTNRQRRSASPYGGYGGSNWGSRGFDDDHRHHHFHGPPHGHHQGYGHGHGQESSWHGYGDSGDRYDDNNNENRGRGSSIYRGAVKYHNSGFRARQEDSASWHDYQQAYNEGNIRRFAAAADAPPNAPPNGLPNTVNLGAFSCQIDCYLSKTKVLENNVINRQIAIEKVKNIFTSVPQEVVVAAIDKCASRINAFTANGSKKQELPPPLRDLPGSCNHTGGFFFMCIHHEIFLNCPAPNWNGNAECTTLKTFVDKCRPSRRADGAPPS